MAKKSITASTCYSTTCIGLNRENDIEAKCKRLLDTLGKGKKAFLLATLIYRFPEYFRTGEVNGELSSLIDRYKKPLERVRTDAPVFFGWHYNEYVHDKYAHELLNDYLEGGSKDFIVYVLSTSLPFFFGNDADIPEKRPVKKEVPSVTVPTEDKESDSNDEYEIEDRVLDQFDDDYVIIPANYEEGSKYKKSNDYVSTEGASKK